MGDGGLFRFGPFIGYTLVLLLVALVFMVCVFLPGCVIYHITRVKDDDDDENNNETSAPVSAEIKEDEFADW